MLLIVQQLYFPVDLRDFCIFDERTSSFLFIWIYFFIFSAAIEDLLLIVFVKVLFSLYNFFFANLDYPKKINIIFFYDGFAIFIILNINYSHVLFPFLILTIFLKTQNICIIHFVRLSIHVIFCFGTYGCFLKLLYCVFSVSQNDCWKCYFHWP